MLATNRLPEILRSVLTDGLEGAVIMTRDGSILSSELIATPGNINATSLAAITSSVWHNLCQANLQSEANYPGEVLFHIMKFEGGTLAITTVDKQHIIAAFGSEVSIGLLRGRLDSLSKYFSMIFEQLNIQADGQLGRTMSSH